MLRDPPPRALARDVVCGEDECGCQRGGVQVEFSRRERDEERCGDEEGVRCVALEEDVVGLSWGEGLRLLLGRVCGGGRGCGCGG